MSNRRDKEKTAPKADPNLPQHKAHTFTDMNDVPEPWRVWRGAKLNLEQVNSIIEDAYDNQFEQEGSLIPDYGGARARFEEKHEIVESLWVRRSKKAKRAEEDDEE